MQLSLKCNWSQWKKKCIFSCKAVPASFIPSLVIQEEGEYCREASRMSSLIYWVRHLFIYFIDLCVLVSVQNVFS